MRVFPHSLRAVLLSATLAGAPGCHAQTKLSPDLTRRVEILIRQRSSVPPSYTIDIGRRSKSEIPGFDQILVTFSDGSNSSKPAAFLLSADNKTLAQFSKYDISQDPKSLVSAEGRPARGGSPSAPVTIVLFDDLECPFCAKMHAALFPALFERYKDQVRVVYRDFPLDQHPWAMRAAIDSNCLATQSTTGYWNYVDYIHAHADELGGTEKSLAKANDSLDKFTLDEATRQRVDEVALNVCIKRQDAAPIDASKRIAESLGVDSTPALFINGEKLEGAQPVEYLYRMIDGALVAAGQTPPPPFVLPPAAPSAAKNAPQSPSADSPKNAGKGGN